MSTMNKTQEKIATALETAFAQHGFAEQGVDALKEATGVSLRTLYKYCPSKEVMITTALEYRHTRYLNTIFNSLNDSASPKAEHIFNQIEFWMSEYAPSGCLFHNAVAAYPNSEALSQLLARHKFEVANQLAQALDLKGYEDELLLIHEGLIQSWPLLGNKALIVANKLVSGYQAERSL